MLQDSLLRVQDMRLDLQEKEAAFLELIADLQQKKGAEQKAEVTRTHTHTRIQQDFGIFMLMIPWFQPWVLAG